MGLNPSEKRNVMAAVTKIASLEQGLEYLGRVVDNLGKEVLKLRAEVDALRPKDAPKPSKSKKDGD